MMTAMHKAPNPVTAAPDPETMPAYDVREIMRGGGQVRMLLDGQTYFLRITRAGKLILTK